jgi:hypothetical protein
LAIHQQRAVPALLAAAPGSQVPKMGPSPPCTTGRGRRRAPFRASLWAVVALVALIPLVAAGGETSDIDALAAANTTSNGTGIDPLAAANATSNGTGIDALAAANTTSNGTGIDPLAAANATSNGTGIDALAAANTTSNGTGIDPLAAANATSNGTESPVVSPDTPKLPDNTSIDNANVASPSPSPGGDASPTNTADTSSPAPVQGLLKTALRRTCKELCGDRRCRDAVARLAFPVRVQPPPAPAIVPPEQGMLRAPLIARRARPSARPPAELRVTSRLHHRRVLPPTLPSVSRRGCFLT